MLLHSKRLKYSRFLESEFDIYNMLASNPEVMRYITGRALTPVEARQRFNAHLIEDPTRLWSGFLAVRAVENNNFMGLAKLTFMQGNEAEIGYSLLPGYWGQGFASEIIECLIAFAGDIKEIHHLIGIADPANTVSVRLLVKYGFVLYKKDLLNELPAVYYKLTLRKQ